MRILSVGVSGIPSSENKDFGSADVLQDYDAVVVDTDSIDSLFGPIKYANREKLFLDRQHGEILLRQSLKRRIEIDGLLEKGGLIVAFMNPIIGYKYGKDDYGEAKYITNYDWLFSRKEVKNELSILSGTGTSFNNFYTKHPFYDYLKLKPRWNSYADIEMAQSHEWLILASAYNTHALSLVKKVKNGYIILLPSEYSSENGEVLENCIGDILAVDEPTQKPEWVDELVVPGQETLVPKLAELNTSIERLENKKEQTSTEIQQLENWKYLLYEKGKHRLETTVRRALSLIGFDDRSDTEQIADGFFNCKYGDAILEVEGSKESIKIKKISQLIRDRANYIEEKKCSPPKGILVGNPFCEEKIDNRPPQGTNKLLFTKELVQTAEKQDVAVILSSDLYDIVCRILKNEMTDEEKASLRKMVFESTGLIRLQ